MMRLCKVLTSILFITSVFALVSTYSYTTQEYMDQVANAVAVDFETEAEDEDERAPQATLVEEELHVTTFFNLLPLISKTLHITFPDFLNLLPQLDQSDFLKPPSL